MTGTTGSGPEYLLPPAKILGGRHDRRHAFRPASVVNISGMSFGSLSPRAVEALNRGASAAPCLHNTGEGGLAPVHRHGGELIFQIGTGYFGCRDATGASAWTASSSASPRRRCARSRSSCPRAPSRASEECCRRARSARRSQPSVASRSARTASAPRRHTAFSDVDGLIDFVERISRRDRAPSRCEVGGRARATSGLSCPGVCARPAPGRTSSRSTAPRAERARRRSRSPTTWRCRSRSAWRACSPSLRRRAQRRRGVHRQRSPGLPGHGDLRVRARLRHDQCGSRGDARDRLRPSAALPHRRLPDGRRDAEPVAHARPRPRRQAARRRELHPRPAGRAALCRDRWACGTPRC